MSFNYIINEYLNYIFMINSTSIYKFNVVKLIIHVVLLVK